MKRVRRNGLAAGDWLLERQGCGSGAEPCQGDGSSLFLAGRTFGSDRN